MENDRMKTHTHVFFMFKMMHSYIQNLTTTENKYKYIKLQAH